MGEVLIVKAHWSTGGTFLCTKAIRLEMCLLISISVRVITERKKNWIRLEDVGLVSCIL